MKQLDTFPNPAYPESGGTNLRELFKFHPDNQALRNPEELTLPVLLVVPEEQRTLAGEELPSNVVVVEALVSDPYIEADPSSYELVRSYGDNLDANLYAAGIDPRTSRQEAIQGKSEYSELTEEWLSNDRFDAVRAWRSLVPTAMALDYLMSPFEGTEVIDKDGRAVRMSKESAMILRFGEDAVAIRARAAAMSTVARNFFLENRDHYSDSEVKWLSLASGTAEPALQAAKNLRNTIGLNPQLVLADLDDKAIDKVKHNAAKYGLQDNFHAITANILSTDLPQHLATRSGDQKQAYDLVEAMGFLEYVYEEGDEVGTFNGSKKRTASEFIKRSFDLVKPGGVFLAGNMVFPRPQSNYVFNVVDWPLINARSEETILRLFKTSGVLSNPENKLELIRVKNLRTHNHVYDIVKVAKAQVA